jgi:hypothetical protein
LLFADVVSTSNYSAACDSDFNNRTSGVNLDIGIDDNYQTSDDDIAIGIYNHNHD